jgi:hypothetical protein
MIRHYLPMIFRTRWALIILAGLTIGVSSQPPAAAAGNRGSGRRWILTCAGSIPIERAACLISFKRIAKRPLAGCLALLLSAG